MIYFISPLPFLAFDSLLVLALHRTLQAYLQLNPLARLQFYQAL